MIESGSLLLVKYSASGSTQWAQTLASDPGPSEFNALVVDSSGSIYAAGSMLGTQAFDFGNGVTATGTPDPNRFYETVGPNFFMVVKYSNTGAAMWAQAVSEVGSSGQTAIAVDAAGGLLIAANHLVKCSSSGTVEWTSSNGGSGGAVYDAVAIGNGGQVYAAGGLDGTVSFGNDVMATGAPDGTVNPSWSARLVSYKNP